MTDPLNDAPLAPDVFADQAEMMAAYGQTWLRRNPDQAEMYVGLMIEEFGEALCAAYPPIAEEIKGLLGRIKWLIENADPISANVDDVELFDGLLDLMVVTLGAGASMGFPMRVGWAEVHASNMAKADETGKVRRRADGKVLKPAGWRPPNLRALLASRRHPSEMRDGARVTEVAGMTIERPPLPATMAALLTPAAIEDGEYLAQVECGPVGHALGDLEEADWRRRMAQGEPSCERDLKGGFCRRYGPTDAACEGACGDLAEVSSAKLDTQAIDAGAHSFWLGAPAHTPAHTPARGGLDLIPAAHLVAAE